MAVRQTNEAEKAAEGAPEKKRRAGKKSGAALTREEMIVEYLAVYHRCMQEDPKSFDAKGALSALDQISKLLGLDTPIKAADVDGNRIILTLAEQVGERGD